MKALKVNQVWLVPQVAKVIQVLPDEMDSVAKLVLQVILV
jgi:hypothetical protein